jgi:glutaredoxin
MNIKANTSAITTVATTIKEPVKTPETPDNRLRETDNVAIWTVMGLEGCPWTAKAVELLKSHKENYKIVFLNGEWQRKLVVQYNCRRSPAIFRGVQYLGSYADLENYYKCWFFSDSEVL